MKYETISTETPKKGVTVIAINRPQRRNAISRATALELQAAFDAFDHDDEQRAAVLTGMGDDAFSAGADVTDLPELWRCVPTVGITTEKPIIAATAGWCVGGALVVAMMCDLIVAADNAQFSYPEAHLGFTGGMISGLAGRIPHHLAMEVMLLGRPLLAQRAYDVGFVNELAPKGRQVAQAVEMASSLAGMAPLVLRTLKRFVVGNVLVPGPSELMARAERDLRVVRDSKDTQEGFSAFREKRAPVYSGH